KSSAKRSGGSSRAAGKSASPRRGSGGGGGSSSKGGIVKRAAGGIREAGSKAVGTVKQHPVAAGVIGAGVATGIAVMAARAVRNSSETGERTPRPEDGDFDAGEQGAAGEAEEGEEQEEAGEDDDDDDSSESDDDDSGGGRFLGTARKRLGGATGSLR